ncbi:hypothetical protein KO489_10235 [Reinekea forsetii]|nr:hypothetical protein [Reinekea forsetii]
MKQITGLIVVLVIAISITFLISWRSTHISAPAQLVDDIRTSQKVTLSTTTIQQVREQYKRLIEAQLISQLKASNIEAPIEASTLMMPLATEFLKDDKAVAAWLNERLSALPKDKEQWQLLEKSASEHVYRVQTHCLTIERMNGFWAFKQLELCDLHS